MNLQLKTKGLKVSLILSIITVLVILIEIYQAYVYLYPNLNVSEDLITTKDIVRVDLKAYEKTIDLLDHLENYSPQPLNLERPNPFR